MTELTHRTCNVCKVEKPVSKCVPSKRYKGGYMPLCHECRAEYYRKRHANHNDIRVAHIGRVRKSRILRTFGMSAADYAQMVERQDHKCALCRSDSNGRSDRYQFWNIDHDHKTGKVRALLCHTCNITIGKFENLVDRVGLRAILDYTGIRLE